MSAPNFLVQQLSECSVLCQCGQGISASVNRMVHAAGYRLRNLDGVEDVVPAYNSLLVRFEKPGWHVDTVEEALMASKTDETPVLQSTLLEIPVCFDASLHNDLATLSQTLRLDAPRIAEVFCATTYLIYMLGFLPGFPYMGALPAQLQLPRRNETRMVTEGAVAIAGAQAGIYPTQSPGGWHVMGYTPLTLFDALRPEPALLQPGQLVQFVAISAERFLQLKEGRL